jgi:LacI family transcriptional regulator
MAQRPHVALMIETAGVYGRRLLQGITRYLQLHRRWSIFLERREIDSVQPLWLKGWRGDGIISRWSNPPVVELIRQLGVPVVDLSGWCPPFGLPRIHSDDHAIGQLAAKHLMERGLRCFAYCGFVQKLWATRRRDGFLEALEQSGFRCPTYESPWSGLGAVPWEEDQNHLENWLKALPRPVGLFACNDIRGFQVLDGCHSAGLNVPEEVAILGVDDDTLLCELCDPSLSSVIPNTEQIGYEAAALLDRLMEGGAAAFEERLIPPLGVANRLSTDVLAIGDRHFAVAMRFIRQHACHGITVDDVLDRIPLSRASLERRFRKYLGRSPHAEIRAVQLGRAKQLLAETDHTMQRIADLVGFEHPEYFGVAFKRAFGRTPGQYRQEARPDSPLSSIRLRETLHAEEVPRPFQ